MVAAMKRPAIICSGMSYLALGVWMRRNLHKL